VPLRIVCRRVVRVVEGEKLSLGRSFFVKRWRVDGNCVGGKSWRRTRTQNSIMNSASVFQTELTATAKMKIDLENFRTEGVYQAFNTVLSIDSRA
jgi:hypothetical protein